jgi:hypothetical protein
MLLTMQWECYVFPWKYCSNELISTFNSQLISVQMLNDDISVNFNALCHIHYRVLRAPRGVWEGLQLFLAVDTSETQHRYPRVLAHHAVPWSEWWRLLEYNFYTPAAGIDSKPQLSKLIPWYWRYRASFRAAIIVRTRAVHSPSASGGTVRHGRRYRPQITVQIIVPPTLSSSESGHDAVLGLFSTAFGLCGLIRFRSD